MTAPPCASRPLLIAFPKALSSSAKRARGPVAAPRIYVSLTFGFLAMEGEQRGGEDRGAFATGLAWGRVAASADWLPLAAASSLCLSRASASCCLRASAFCCSRASALTQVLKTVCRSRASASADWRPLRSSGRLALTRPKDSPFAHCPIIYTCSVSPFGQ